MEVPFTPGRTDASQEQTDAHAFAPLEPAMDGFRNYTGDARGRQAEVHLVDRAHLLGLSGPEMTVLVGGLRVLGANYGGSELGVFTKRPGTLTNDYFVNLLDMTTTWKSVSESDDRFEGRDRRTGELKWTGSRVDLIFGVEFAAPGHRGSVRVRRLGRGVRERLRGRVDQGDEPGSVRPGLIRAHTRA